MKTDILIIIVGVALLALVWVGWTQFQALRGLPDEREGVFCTADAKRCSDGSFVGRTPPHCAFAECPSERR